MNYNMCLESFCSWVKKGLDFKAQFVIKFQPIFLMRVMLNLPLPLNISLLNNENIGFFDFLLMIIYSFNLLCFVC
jgi:hypothetical protein